MQDLHSLTETDLQSLAPEAVAALAQQMLQRLRCQDDELKFKDAKIEKITFQLARLIWTPPVWQVRFQSSGSGGSTAVLYPACLRSPDFVRLLALMVIREVGYHLKHGLRTWRA